MDVSTAAAASSSLDDALAALVACHGYSPVLEAFGRLHGSRPLLLSGEDPYAHLCNAKGEVEHKLSRTVVTLWSQP